MTDFQDWVKNAEDEVLSWFQSEDAAIIAFFVPLMAQVKTVALTLGKQDLQVGLGILKDAAMAAVVSAATAPAGTQVAAAEATFLTVGAAEGITAIHNAEAGAIKAAVAIVQTGATAAAATGAISDTTAKTISDEAGSVGETIQKALGGE